MNCNTETMSITSHHFIDKFFSCISNEGALTLGSKILEYKQSENYKSQILQYSLWAIACACIAAATLFQKEAKNSQLSRATEYNIVSHKKAWSQFLSMCTQKLWVTNRTSPAVTQKLTGSVVSAHMRISTSVSSFETSYSFKKGEIS